MEIEINQALHGYADGHQLLACSLDLTKDQHALLLVMSDLSGPAFRSGFESYLTGYPLQGAGYYCYARTWFAPELPRPGCVWTHTLIIRNEDLAQIQDFRSLDTVFCRPETPPKIERYETRALFQNPSFGPSSEPRDARAALGGLYGSARQIVIPSENSSIHEALVLAIFDQQWPRLRRHFRFCTGTLSLREAEFDLSVSPPEVTHSLGDSGLVVNDRGSSEGEPEEWLELANRDLYGSVSQSAYRQFLWRFGPDYVNGRAAFRPLTELFLLIEQNGTDHLGEKALSAIAYFYPKENEARRLKSELFGRDGYYTSKMGEEAITRLLLTHPSASALDRDTASIKERTIELIRKDEEGATSLAILAGQLNSENAALLLDAYFAHSQWSDAIMARIPLPLILDMVSRQPCISSNPSLWMRLDGVEAVSNILPGLASDPCVLNGALQAMIDARAWGALARAVDQLGAAALLQVFEIIESSQSEALDYSDEFFAIVSSQPSVLVDLILKMKIGPKSLRLLTSELDPRSRHWRRLGLSPWIAASKIHSPLLTSRRAIRSAVFFLALGLASNDQDAGFVIAFSFTKVYEAAKSDALSDSLWDELESTLSWYSPSWDKCARLIKTVVRAFKERPWPLQYFPETFRTSEEFSRALHELDETRSGRRYIHRLRDAEISGELTWFGEQLSLLAKFV